MSYIQQQKQQRHEENSTIIGACQTLYSFQGLNEKELSFKPGELIYITKKNPNWWGGTHVPTGKFGYFSRNYVKEVPYSSPTQTKIKGETSSPSQSPRINVMPTINLQQKTSPPSSSYSSNNNNNNNRNNNNNNNKEIHEKSPTFVVPKNAPALPNLLPPPQTSPRPRGRTWGAGGPPAIASNIPPRIPLPSKKSSPTTTPRFPSVQHDNVNSPRAPPPSFDPPLPPMPQGHDLPPPPPPALPERDSSPPLPPLPPQDDPPLPPMPQGHDLPPPLPPQDDLPPFDDNDLPPPPPLPDLNDLPPPPPPPLNGYDDNGNDLSLPPPPPLRDDDDDLPPPPPLPSMDMSDPPLPPLPSFAPSDTTTHQTTSSPEGQRKYIQLASPRDDDDDDDDNDDVNDNTHHHHDNLSHLKKKKSIGRVLSFRSDKQRSKSFNNKT